MEIQSFELFGRTYPMWFLADVLEKMGEDSEAIALYRTIYPKPKLAAVEISKEQLNQKVVS